MSPSARGHVQRLIDGPIIHAGLDPSIGDNIQGPSLVRVPTSVPGRLGTYYLYFADHKGSYIRLAYGDTLTGPWKIHVPGSLQLVESLFLTEPPAVTAAQRQAMEQRMATQQLKLSHDLMAEITTPHIASPDVHVLPGTNGTARFRMYFHGLEGVGHQVSRVAESTDGIYFTTLPEIIGRPYMRIFSLHGMTYAMSMPGQFYRSGNGLTGFEAGPLLFNPDMRHAALLLHGTTLYVFWTQVGEAPERMYLSTIDVSADWQHWQVANTHEVLRPERPWEGADAPLVTSVRSTAYGKVNQLRDPALFEEDGHIYLLYAVAGESGIAIAKVTFEPETP